MPETVSYAHAEPYTRVSPGHPLRPYVSVVLEHGGLSLATIALVDSGADVSVFNTVWADLLGLARDPSQAEIIAGIGGSVPVWYLDISLIFGGKRFPARVAFTDAIDDDAGILGRDSFFIKFAIGIDEPGKRVLYQPMP